jgi:glycosyltransferase involved in cell wall biosynthesis
MVGGAETLLQGYAEQLAEHGYSVEVLTTCADQLGEWKNALDPGEVTIRGVHARRFPIDMTDLKRYWQLADELNQTGRLDYRKQQALLRASLDSAALSAELRRSIDRYDAVIVGPYAFGLTFEAARAAAGKAIWVPCLHDEPLAHMAVVREALEEARGLLFNTEAEERFARQRLGLVNPASAVVGYGFAPDYPRGDAARFRARYGVEGPFILYTGRIIPEKNIGELLGLFERYRLRNPAISLVMTGEGGGVDIARPGVRAVGRLPTGDLRDAYAAADLFCQPSRNESFSIVIMESWLQGRPVLVHRDCDVTREHVERSGGGWIFGDLDSFAAAVSSAVAEPAAAEMRGRKGQAYVQERYAWPAVSGRLARALGEMLAEPALARQLSQRGVRRALEFTRERYRARLSDLLEEALPEEQRLSVDQLLAPLRQSGAAGVPAYRVESHIPVLGPLIGRVRRALTAHIKEPYIDVIAQQQATFNADLVDRLQYALEHALREQRRMERRIRMLEAQIDAAQRPTDSPESSSS